jgi:hypothetical protein
MEHRVTLKNSSKTLTFTFAAGVNIANITVAAGTWEIKVEAYYDDILLGSGTTETETGTITVTAGSTVTASVTMTQNLNEMVFLVGNQPDWNAALVSPAELATYIYITKDFPFQPDSTTTGISGKLTILGGNHTITFTPSSQGSFLTIDGGDVTMQDLKVKVAAAAGTSNTAPLVEINSGTFTMKSGELSGNTNNGSDGDGGVVYVASNGTFTMTGGTILGNTAGSGGGSGGGVGVYGGTFNMYGGTISGNSTAFGGGVSVTNGTFIKTGGTIYGNDGTPNSNTATNSTSGTPPTSYGHAVYVSSGQKYRNTTAGPGVNLDSNKTAQQGGGWEN